MLCCVQCTWGSSHLCCNRNLPYICFFILLNYHLYIIQNVDSASLKETSCFCTVLSSHPFCTVKPGDAIRPDLIDVLFLGSFPYQFQKIERNKKKKKNRKKIAWQYCLFKKKYFLFPRFFLTFLESQCTGGSQKQQINWVWPKCRVLSYIVTIFWPMGQTIRFLWGGCGCNPDYFLWAHHTFEIWVKHCGKECCTSIYD